MHALSRPRPLPRWPWVVGWSAWHGGGLLLAAAVSALAWWAVPVAPVAIPARDGASSVLWPLIPVLSATCVPLVLGCADRDAERASARGQWGLRVRALLGCGGGLLLAAVPAARFDLVVVARNTVVLAGVAALGCAVYPAAAWVAVTLTPMTMWLLGTDPVDRRLAAWAVLLAPRSDGVAAVSALVCATVGGTAYLARGWFITRPFSTRARQVH